MKLKTVVFLAIMSITLSSCSKTRTCECTQTNLSTGETKITTSTVGGSYFKNNNQQNLETECSQGDTGNSTATKTCKLKD